jgi:hypothetical protein
VTDVHHHDDTEPPDGHDAHGHDEEPLGPVGVPAWGAGVIGVLLGIAVAAAFVLATAPI